MDPDRIAKLPALSPEFLARYEILSELGHGGMAFVLEARQRNLDRRVAIKLLRINDDFEEEDVERLLREGRMLATLRHARILEVYDAGWDGRTPYMVAELVEGESLAALIERGRVPLRRALEIVAAVADALAHAHDHGITHRDVKPENVLLLPDGELKLADFGLARQTAGGARLTQVGMILGTPSYMSPEQIIGPTVGPESDQYALAIVAYELVLGVLPFVGETPLEKAFARIKTDATPPKKLNPAVPGGLDALIVQALARDPARRFLTIAHMREAVHKILEKLGPVGDEVLVPVPRAHSKAGVRRTGLTPAVELERSADTLALSTSNIRLTRATRTVPRGTQSVPLSDQSDASEAPEPSATELEQLTTGTTLELVARPHYYRRFASAAALIAVAIGGVLAMFLRPEAPDRSSVLRRTVKLLPRGGPGSIELHELDRVDGRLCVRLKTDVPLALVAMQEVPGAVPPAREIARESAPALEHVFTLDPARAVGPSTLTLSAADGSAEPHSFELPGLRTEHRKLVHRLDRGRRPDVLHDVTDEWNRAGERAARVRVEKLAENARGRAERLLALAPFLLDCLSLSLAERKQIYDLVSELRVLDRFLIAFGQPTLDAHRALGRTFRVGLPDGALEPGRAGGGSTPKLAVRVTTVVMQVETDMLAGDLAPTPWGSIPLATDPAKVGRAALELAMPMMRAADLYWIRLGDWRLLVTTECAREPVRLGLPARFYHGLDPALLKANNDLTAEVDQLPAVIPPGPVTDIAAGLLAWPRP